MINEKIRENNYLSDNPLLSGIGGFQIFHISEIERMKSLLVDPGWVSIIRGKMNSKFNEDSYTDFLFDSYPDLPIDEDCRKQYRDIGERIRRELFR